MAHYRESRKLKALTALSSGVAKSFKKLLESHNGLTMGTRSIVSLLPVSRTCPEILLAGGRGPHSAHRNKWTGRGWLPLPECLPACRPHG